MLVCAAAFFQLKWLKAKEQGPSAKGSENWVGESHGKSVAYFRVFSKSMFDARKMGRVQIGGCDLN